MRAANPDVTLTPQAIVLRVPIRFKPGAPKLAPGVKAELEGVADLLSEHPEIKMLRVEAHWSGAGRKGKGTKGADPSKQLTERQAKAIRDYLISKGAPADRVEAVGVGGECPWSRTSAPATRPRTAGSSWSSSARARAAPGRRGQGAARLLRRGYNRAHAAAFASGAGFAGFSLE